MNIFAIDTSSKYFSLVIAKDTKILASVFKPYAKELSRKIMPAIDKALRESGVSLKQIDYFAIGLGPGSFTALRIGLATLKGLAFPFNKPVVGVVSLDVAANSQGITKKSITEGLVCPIIDAKRSLVYSAIYSLKNGQLRRKSRYFLLAVDELLKKIKRDGKVIFSGDGLLLYRNDIEKGLGLSAGFVDERFWYPEPASLLACAREKIKNKEFSPLDKIVPLYLYPKECQIVNKQIPNSKSQ